MTLPVEAMAMLEKALGNPPFHWQQRLLGDFCGGRMPRSLDLPTGLGKTAVMAIWLVARAHSARDLPRRLVYIVDRRAVVDQATSEAERLRTWAQTAANSNALGLDGRALPISTLRGQFVDNREWLEDPTVPAIIVGTVDMIGSRLLFEGYACSRKMRPFHAGMLGTDTLFVLDESHLVPPFERLLDSIAETATLHAPDLEDSVGIARPWILSLSATGRERQDAFRLTTDEQTDPVVRERLQAKKVIRLKTIVDADNEIAEALAREAWDVAERTDHAARVVVFCNSREHADDAKRALVKIAKQARGGGNQQPAAELFVGARRVRERTLATKRLSELGFIAGSPRASDHAFLFATSAAEVGVDLDADHMVADLVPWERMVQRLGRVNRRGQGSAEAIVLWAPKPDSPVQTVAQLIDHLPSAPNTGRDASPAALDALRAEHGELVVEASTPAPLYPALTRPVLDSWAMTSLRAHTGRPEVQPWLRGWIDAKPQTSIYWRTELPPGDSEEGTLRAYFEAAPPHTSERLETETWRTVGWVRKRASRISKRADASCIWTTQRVAYLLDAAGEYRGGYCIEDLTAKNNVKSLVRALGGAQIVIDARFGGLSPDGLLDEGEDDAPITAESDVTNEVWLPMTAGGMPPVPFRVATIRRAESIADANWRERLRLPISESASDEEVQSWLVIEKWRHDATTEDDRSSGHPQTLTEHQSWTKDQAQRIGNRLGLPNGIRQVLMVAARLHDEGKRAPRWQRAFNAPKDGAPYAKTLGPVNVQLLDGYRHEFGSLPTAEADAEFRTLPRHMQELTLHLIAAHHGFARPSIETKGCDDAPPSMMAARAQQVALRFMSLQERYGPWGLAYLETLLRAADQRASRANDERDPA